MNCTRRQVTAGLLIALGALGGCASLPESAVARPEVSLRDVQVMGLGFKNQTFLLSFDVRNPNPFPLPVNHVRYGVRLDGHRFASGDTPCDMSIPANGETELSISVELDLLSTAPQLLSIVRDSTRSEVPYELEGRFGLDLPIAASVSYRKSGAIRLNSSGF